MKRFRKSIVKQLRLAVNDGYDITGKLFEDFINLSDPVENFTGIQAALELKLVQSLIKNFDYCEPKYMEWLQEREAALKEEAEKFEQQVAHKLQQNSESYKK